MANTKTLQRVREKIRKSDGAMTMTKIREDLAVNPKSLNDVIEILEEFGVAEVITNGKTKLIRKKNEHTGNPREKMQNRI